MTFAKNPRFFDWGPGYRVSRKGLARLTGLSAERLDAYFAELEPLHRILYAEAGGLLSGGALMQAPLLYVLIRATAPSRVVETGVSSGYSARLMLEALDRNGAGRLDSIGLNQFAGVDSAPGGPRAFGGRPVGFLVPDRLRPRWGLHLGPSERLLPPVLAGLDGPLDLFLHDSLHQYPTMRAEYESAWPNLAPGGWLASHDIHANRAWPDFLREKRLENDEQLDHDLGVVRRPNAG